MLDNSMTRNNAPDVGRTVIREEGNSIIPRRREGSAEEIAAVTLLQKGPITHTEPVVEDTTVSTRDRSVEENRTTNSDRSNKRKVSRESSTQNIHVTTDSENGRASSRERV